MYFKILREKNIGGGVVGPHGVLVQWELAEIWIDILPDKTWTKTLLRKLITGSGFTVYLQTENQLFFCYYKTEDNCIFL